MTGDVLAGHDTARTQKLDRTGRDHNARLNLAAYALDHDEPETWLTEMLDILGLNRPGDGKTSSLPSMKVGDGQTVTTRNRYQPRIRTTPGGVQAHGTYARYSNGCHCDPCDLAGVNYRLDLKARKQAAR